MNTQKPYKRKTIQTYVDLERPEYNRFVAIARTRGVSAATLLGSLVRRYLTRKTNEIQELENYREE